MGLGAVAAAETLRSTGLLRGQVIPLSWYGQTLALNHSSWLPPAAIAAVLLGLALLTITLKPRRRTHLAVHPLESEGSVLWIRSRDAARLAADAARHVDSVTSASATAKRRTLRATVTTFGDPQRVTDEVRTTVDARLSTLTPNPKLRITLQED
ncbi:hypothetical protein GCM10009804_68030 [Kribbella hippodromi]|uniref:DUF6286 domain-containing protein n=2 Tax=Kribbella hippodromi TaxID=434347 RepID=A0ABP4QBG1_9ACTN